MFNILKKHFSKSVDALAKKVIEKKISEGDIENFFNEYELYLLQANVAFKTVEAIKENLKKKLLGQEIKRTKAKEMILDAFKKTLLDIVDLGKIDIEKIIKDAKHEKTPCIVFLGFNGSGKTTSMAKLAKYLLNKKFTVVFAAADSFRAASIEQLTHHGDKLGIKTIKHDYGADPAAVVFDAIKYADAHNIDVVLADTAGRVHSDKNLMDELSKIIRVNKPVLKVLVIDSLTGNDAVEQAVKFNEGVGIDCVVFTKVDVNEKGGSILSVCNAVKKPVLFLGTGQNYDDIEFFDPKKFVNELLGEEP